MKLLPTETIKQYDKLELIDEHGELFVLNQKNFYSKRHLFFKDKGFNRTDEAWDSKRHSSNFFSVVRGEKSVFLIYDLRKNLEMAKKNLTEFRNVVESQDTIDYCKDLISRGHLYVIIDGQNRETNNKMWYEGELPNTKEYGFKSFHGYVNSTEIIKLDEQTIPSSNKSRQIYYIHPDAPTLRKEKWKKILSECKDDKKEAKKLYKRGGETYLYEKSPGDKFIKSYDEQNLSVHLVTSAYYCQVPELYDRYNNQEKNKPVELRNAKQGKLSTYKKSLMWDGDKNNFPTKTFTEMGSHLLNFGDIDPRDAYYNDMISDGNENRMGGFLLAEEEFQFLDNPTLLESSSDEEYKDLYEKYYSKLPSWFDTHQELVKFRTRMFTSYNHKQAKFKMKRKNALDYFIFGYDLMNPMKMFDDLNFSPLELLSDEILNEMTDKEKNDFAITSIEILDDKKFSKWLCDDVLIKEYIKKRDDEDKWDTETAYFNRLSTNKLWKLRRMLFRGSFLEDIKKLMSDNTIRIKDKKRVISDIEFIKLTFQNDMKDSSGNLIPSFADLFEKYAKSHTLPYSSGVHKGGVTTKSTTDIDTKEENLKLGAKPKVLVA